MIAFVLACALWRPVPHVTYQTGGAKVEVILRELSAQTGIALHAGPRVRGEILILDVKDRPLDETMKAIAEADGAVWQPDGAGYELTRTSRMEDDQAAAELAARTAEVERTLADQLKTSLAPLPPKSSANLFERIAWRSMEALGPSALAKVKSGTRVVYSTDPHPSQRRWPGNFRQILQAYDEERPRSASADKLIANLPSQVNRVLVAVANSLFDGLTVSVYLYDAKGALIDNSIVAMQTSELNEIEQTISGKTTAPSGEPLTLSANANQFMNFAREAMAGKPGALTPDLVGLVLDPAKYDPLSFFVADALTQVARRNSRSLVASVPDMTFLTGLFLGARGVTETAVRRWISHPCEIDESKAGWMVIHPRYPIEVRDLRVDRERMGAFYRTAWKNGGVRLAELGAYVSSQPRRYVETLSPFYGLFCLPEITSMFSPDSTGALRVYGTLSDPQRAALEAGKPLPLETLRRESLVELADWIFTSPIYRFRETYGGTYVDVTDAFPNGLTTLGALSATSSVEDAVIQTDETGKRVNAAGRPMTAPTLGFLLGGHDLGEERGEIPTYFLFGQQANLRLAFSSPAHNESAQLTETRFDRNGRVFKLQDLPAAFLKAVSTSRTERINMPVVEPAKTPPPR